MIQLAALSLVLVGPLTSLAPAGELPGPISRAYATAQAALREGNDADALAAWKRARTQLAELPAERRYDRATRDAVVRQELRLADIARRRFDRISAAVVTDDTDAARVARVAEKTRLLALLVAETDAIGADGHAGALWYVADLNPALRGTHCQRAELIARFQRFLLEVPCDSSVGDLECEIVKTRTADETSLWRDESARAAGACRE